MVLQPILAATRPRAARSLPQSRDDLLRILQVLGCQLDHLPPRRPRPQHLSDRLVPPHPLARVERRAVDVDRRLRPLQHKVRDADRLPAFFRRDGHLLLNLDAVLLEQPQEGQLER